MFDVDCDPQTIARGLAPLESAAPGSVQEGTRLPGCFDPFETACRAVLGQQVSVAAANKLAARIVERYGASVETRAEGLTHVFPTPAEILALDPIGGALGELGVIKTRSRVIADIARMLESGELDLGPGALVDEQVGKLLSIKGIGPWTASYIAMRAMGHPDAFLESDAGVARALPGMTPKQRLEAAEAWRPWRSYAVIGLWNSLAE
jgi:AraC family transcriptional regulator of adaptative response / DNA-3-methyladenine glycosylase II